MIIITFTSVDKEETVPCPADSPLILRANVIRFVRETIGEYRNLMWWVKEVPYTNAHIATNIILHFMAKGRSGLALGPYPSLRLAGNYLYAGERMLASLQPSGLWHAYANAKPYETIVMTCSDAPAQLGI
jgi:hypothetical protein